jgi:acetyl esterase/lipase
MTPGRGWAASLSLACCVGAADAEPGRWQVLPAAAATTAPRPANDHLSTNDRLDDMLEHPALEGFAELLLPRADVAVDRKARLGDFGSLLPYHTHVEARDVVAGLNRLIDDASAGRRVFFDIYTDAEKKLDSTKVDTGMFFLRGRPGAPFAVIAPGGGFSYVATVHEGLPYALGINRHGYNAFVLRYRVGQGGAAANEDLASALSTIFRNAATLEVSTEDYSLWGSSAGARMAATIGSRSAASAAGVVLPKPIAVVMAYTGHSDTSANEPPTFVVVGEHDRIAPPAVMERRVQILQRAGVMVAYRRIPELGHGFGLGTGTTAEGWIDDAVRFWELAARQHPSSR